MMRNVRTRFKASDKSVLKNHGGSDISSFNKGYQRRLIFFWFAMGSSRNKFHKSNGNDVKSNAICSTQL